MKYTQEQLDAMPVGTALRPSGPKHSKLLFVKATPETEQAKGWFYVWKGTGAISWLTQAVLSQENFTHIATPQPLQGGNVDAVI